MKMRRGAALGALALSVVGMVAAYRLGRARADGVPMVNPLYYGGMLDDGGRPVEGTRNVTVRLWDAATAGATVCTTNAGATAFSGGRFRVALDGACVGAVRANTELWAELQVEGTVFPRSKLGAVPYALEAGRATGAAGALEARLAAVEGRPTGGRQVVIGDWRPTSAAVDNFSIPCPSSAAVLTIPLMGPQFTIAFTASTSSYYEVTSVPVTAVAANDTHGNSYSVRLVSVPSLGTPLRISGHALYQLEAGRRYVLSLEILAPDARYPPCVGPMTGTVTAPFVVEQFN